MDVIHNMLKGTKITAAIDFAADRTRLIVQQASKGGTKGRVLELPGADLSQGVRESVVEALRLRVREQRMREARCRVSLAAGCFRCEMARLPAMSDTEVGQSARFEAMDRFGVEPSDTVIRHVSLGGKPGEPRQVLLMSLPLGTARHAAEAVMAAGLQLDSVEHAAIAGLRAATELDAGMATGTVAWLHVEPRVVSLLVQHDGELRFMRDFEGEWAVTPRTHTRTHVMHRPDDGSIPLAGDDAEESLRWSCLAEDVLRGLRQSCGEQSWPTRLMVAGGTADAALCQALVGVCGVQACLAPCTDWMTGIEGTRDHAWASAMGVALVTHGTESVRRAA
jgi:hypothetical protein